MASKNLVRLMAKSCAKSRGWELWSQMGNPKFVCAPMVDQSELPFRLLASDMPQECRVAGAAPTQMTAWHTAGPTLGHDAPIHPHAAQPAIL